ncbi:hypothetical protein M378DRAFT_173864 [Amanita muscaria Koide BX008]|uniref:Uncharacterized protein n=1 Tax=Amanita muscaria (strain Koide BX008) TaxID=946122 RepID=A0A0C2W1U8_AMAMK|nr:hypothetical protein M378DRAFT_173864 [Amanita muscaria Koide BX008]
MPNNNSPESMKLLLIYPSLVLTTLALTTSTMFIAHFEGETVRGSLRVIKLC